jgi:hypothetical protein
MLNYLVTSKTRRALLKLLWSDGVSGTTTDLAEESGVAFAGAYKELKAMVDSGLAKVEWSNNRKVFSADPTHPMASLLKKLVKQPKNETRLNERRLNLEKPNKLRENLAFLGLPVNAKKTSPDSHVTIEELLADAADLAQVDASVARSLPVLFHKFGESLDFDTLRHESWKRGNKHQVGFFLELTGELSNRKFFKEASKSFLDKRYKVPRQFFGHQTELSRRLAERRTPNLAKKWGLQMNMGLDAFESTYEKFAHESVSA